MRIVTPGVSGCTRASGLGGARKHTHRIVENVREALGQPIQCLRRPIHREEGRAAIGDRADIVHAVRMIGVFVCEQHCIDSVDPISDQLQPQLRRRVDEKSRPAIPVSTNAPTRMRLSRGSGERHTAQPHPIWGTPKLVPVPRKVSLTRFPSHEFDFQEIGRPWYAKGVTRGEDDAVAWHGEPQIEHRLLPDFRHLGVRRGRFHDIWNDPPHERKPVIRPLIIGQRQDGHWGTMR